ncbi:substrate-binding domain-containing protein, partial [Frankia casuarinae]
ALRAAGAPVTSVLRSGFLRAEAMRATLAAIAGSYQPDAIFATTEEHAHGVLAAARAAGVRVPDDLAVLAMDGLPEGEFAAPPLSTVAVDIAGFADMAVNEALNPGPGDTRVTVFGVRLVPRLSCGCAPAPARTSTSTTDV